MTQKSVLWAEDLEGHRQPSLYYLGEEEGADGTHLVCNWNGAPTDFDDYGLDTLISYREYEAPPDDNLHVVDNKTTEAPQGTPAADDDDYFVDYPNPAAELIDLAQQGPCTEPRSRRMNDLDLKECAHLDFLSVPPTSSGLLRRLVKNLLSMGEKLKQPPGSSTGGCSNGGQSQEPLHSNNKQNEPPPNQQSKLSTINNSSNIPTKQKISKCHGDREVDSRKMID